MDDKNYSNMSIAELEEELHSLDDRVQSLRAQMKIVHGVLDRKVAALPPSAADPKLKQIIK